jgi:nucleotide-binding universal stress UspA family protein
MEIKKIVFPVNLAGSSYRIASSVRSLVDRFNAELHIIYVMEPPFKGYNTFFIPHRSLDLDEQETVTLAERHLQEFAEKYFEGFPRVKCVAMYGDPVEQIQRYVETEDMDMVVVATHDRRPFRRAVFGDVAEKIAKTSLVPVVVINPFNEEKRKSYLKNALPRSRSSKPSHLPTELT